LWYSFTAKLQPKVILSADTNRELNRTQISDIGYIFQRERWSKAKQQHYPSKTWYLATKPKGAKRLFISLKVSDESEALIEGRRLEREIAYKHDNSLPLRVPDYETLFNQYLRYITQKTANKEPSGNKLFFWNDTLLGIHEMVIKRYLKSYFIEVNPIPLERINRLYINRCREWLRTAPIRWEPDEVAMSQKVSRDRGYLSNASINRYLSVLNQFLKWCVLSGYLNQEPQFEWLDAQQTERRRSTLTKEEYEQALLPTLNRWVEASHPDNNTGKKGDFLRWYRQRWLLKHYILILANTGWRVHTNLQFSDVQMKTYEGEETITFNIKGEKGHDYDALPNPSVRRYLNRLKHLYEKEGHYSEDSYLFSLSNGKKMGKPSHRMFQGLMTQAGLLHDEEGVRRTFYGFRHFHITRQLEEGVPIFTIARSHGTSTEQIERTYAHYTPERFYAQATKNSWVDTRLGDTFDSLGFAKPSEFEG